MTLLTIVNSGSGGPVVINAGWPIAQDGKPHIEATRAYWSTLEPFTHGFYINDLEPDHNAAAIQANYRQNHQRLVAVKNRYDPTNLFRLNANVQPSTTATG